MTDITTEAVERTHRVYINRAMVFDAGVTWTTVAGIYPHAYVPEEAYRAILADRDRLSALLDASQSTDPVTNADSCQPTRTYEDRVRDALAAAVKAVENERAKAEVMFKRLEPYDLYIDGLSDAIIRIRPVEAIIKEKSHE